MSKPDALLQTILDRLDALAETMTDRLDALTSEIDTLTRGLSLMSDTQRTHSDMLAEVLTACSADPGSSTELSESLDRIAAAVEQQTETLAGIDGHLSNLGQIIEVSVMRGIVRVDAQREAVSSGRTDADGVLLDDDDYT